jgi:hypothetical protein
LRLPPPLQIKDLPTETLNAAIGRVFDDLTRVIGYLDVLASAENSSGSGTSQVVHLYTTLQVESLMMVDYVEGQVLTAEGIPAPLHSALDAICFAIRHEIHRAFTHGTIPDGNGLDAMDILRNCFQQSYLILAKVFNPALESEAIFGGLHERREQSLALWEDLIELVGAVRDARAEMSQPAMARLLALLEHFRAGSMKYLMSRDWDTFETFADELKSCRRLDDAAHQLHRLDCYLELLLSHVRMRSALSDLSL